MRRTVLPVAAVIALGIAATVDALRVGGGDPGPAKTTTTTDGATTAPSPADELRAAGVSGTVFFTLRSDEGCELHAVRLPALQETGVFLFDSCRFDISSRGSIVTGPPCPGRVVEVRQVGAVGGSSDRFRGCAPAWKPSGELTFVRNGDVVTEEEKVLVRDVARHARQALGEGALHVQQLAWLTDTRLAAVVGTRAVRPHVVVVTERGKAVAEPIFIERSAAIDVRRDTQEILIGGGGAGQIFDHRGRFVSASRYPFPDIGAVATSPDGQWVALARPDNVCIYQETTPPPRERFPITCLPSDAVDLAWR